MQGSMAYIGEALAIFKNDQLQSISRAPSNNKKAAAKSLLKALYLLSKVSGIQRFKTTKNSTET
jgi:hypothetical protein